MEETVKQRLEKFYKEKGLTKRGFEKRLGFSNGYMDKLRNQPKADKMEIIYQTFPELDKVWLMTGEGTMIKQKFSNKVSLDGEIPEEIANAVFSHPVSELEYVTENSKGAMFFRDQYGVMRISVPHVPYACHAEFANMSDRLDPDREGWQREMYVVDKKVRGNYLSFDVKGDSMDNGTRDCLQDGDKVLVRELEHDFWKDLHVGQHRYWVLVFDSSVLIKQIVSENREDGTIICHSLNPSPEYSDFSLKLDDVRYLYYVVRIKPREIYL